MFPPISLSTTMQNGNFVQKFNLNGSHTCNIHNGCGCMGVVLCVCCNSKTLKNSRYLYISLLIATIGGGEMFSTFVTQNWRKPSDSLWCCELAGDISVVVRTMLWMTVEPTLHLSFTPCITKRLLFIIFQTLFFTRVEKTDKLKIRNTYQRNYCVYTHTSIDNGEKLRESNNIIPHTNLLFHVAAAYHIGITAKGKLFGDSEKFFWRYTKK